MAGSDFAKTLPVGAQVASCRFPCCNRRQFLVGFALLTDHLFSRCSTGWEGLWYMYIFFSREAGSRWSINVLSTSECLV